ncbi:MAG TPA: hypothetical protein VG498_18455 [Terriglobales bacterium]|nr:hypothetical protein [Terriglobales bacterium]
MRYIVRALILISVATLGGCTEGVLDPKGPIAAAERQIMFNSLGIMLAIVIPTILAILGAAYVSLAQHYGMSQFGNSEDKIAPAVAGFARHLVCSARREVGSAPKQFRHHNSR